MRTSAGFPFAAVVSALATVLIVASTGIAERAIGAEPPANRSAELRRPSANSRTASAPRDSLLAQSPRSKSTNATTGFQADQLFDNGDTPKLFPAPAVEPIEPRVSALETPAGTQVVPPSPDAGEQSLVPMPTHEELQYVDVHEEPTLIWATWEALTQALTGPIYPMANLFGTLTCAEHDEVSTELSPYAIGIQPLPERPPLLFEYNDKFLSPGWLEQGIEMPTGVVWRPSIWVFGEYRVNYAFRENPMGVRRVSEVAQRLDLFGQLNLSGTERVLVGLRPMDREARGLAGGGTQGIREFNSYDFRTETEISGWNSDIQTLFFEGDFGEIFPNLDPYDSEYLDYGFSVGRQPLSIQDGLMINEDMIDLASVTRNTLFGGGSLNTRATAVYAWNRVNRHDQMITNRIDPSAEMVGLFTESDFPGSTMNADVAYVTSDLGGLWVWGLSAVQRLHGYHNTYNTSFHVLGSHPTGDETSVAGQGELLFGQVSWTPHCTEDLIYINGFWAIDQFTSATRGPLQGGPLGQTGILFAATELGRYGPALANQANNAYGGSIGYQMFFDHTRQQIITELGFRDDTQGLNNGAIAATIRYQRACGQHWILVMDALVAKQESIDALTDGARVELRAKF